ncbi:MAG: AmmeMemoRadiSam system protein B [Anaerolineales bacterium]|nr:AmmeMemoRadiSam system protein B [Anaerolineales bacterium]
MSSQAETDVRPSPIAGTWYPDDPTILARTIDSLLAAATNPPLPGTVVGVIAPHAGHRYSGAVAAHAFRCLEAERPEVVAVVSPLHTPHPARLLTTTHQSFWTPLGTIPVAQDLLGRLAELLLADSAIRLETVAHDSEHSLEIELPFLQRALRQPFRLLPLMVREQSPRVAEAVGRALATVLSGTPAVLVGSTDLSHFFPADVARRLDAEMLTRIAAFDPVAVMAAEDEGVGFACGRASAAAVLWAARQMGADCARILRYGTSGDVTRDQSSVVGYAAAAIYRSTG